MSCRAIRDWLHRSADSLDEAQRLVLDVHLAACERCRGDRARMLLVHRIGTSLQAPPPHAREYNRAIARALLGGAGRAASTTASSPTGSPAALAAAIAPPRRWALPLAFAATAAAAAAIVAVWLARGEAPRSEVAGAQDGAAHAPPIEPGDRAVQAPPPPSPAPADRVEEGVLRDGAAALAAGAAVPASSLLRAIEPSRLRLASMRVVVAAGAELRWVPPERTILLERGSLDVEAGPDGAARIVTARFEVVAQDASLAVDRAGVRVRRGAARIVDRKRAITARIEAGGAWSPQDPARPGRPTADAPSASRLLAEARAHFAARDHVAAERAAEAALASAPARTEAAEAHTLLGDIAQSTGELERAVKRYLNVVAKYADLPAAESALYAAARLELRRAHASEARALLARYLDRYPSGRYADDARRQLASTP